MVIIPQAEELGADQLTDEQKSAIEEFKDSSWDEPKKEEPEKADSKKAPEKEKEPEKEDDGTLPEDDAAKKIREEQEVQEAAETKRIEDKAKKDGKTVDEVKQLEATEKAEQERIEKVAKDEGITVEEVKENEAKDKSVAERHGNDPVKIARALRKEQSEYGKIKGEAESLRQFKAQVEAQQAKFSQERFDAVMEKDKEKIISTYREKYPEEAERSDDAIFERAKALIQKGLEAKQQVKAKEIETQASTKRAEIVKALPEEYKDYIPEIKELLKECSDSQVIDKDFDVDYLANYARGKKLTPEYVKSLEDAAYKRGVEQPKIMPKVPGAKPSGAKRGDDVIAKMSSEDKARAEEIYGRKEGWSKEKMWTEYMKNDKDKDF